MSVWFRTLAFVAPSMETAQTLAGPSTATFMLFGGFLIAKSKLEAVNFDL